MEFIYYFHENPENVGKQTNSLLKSDRKSIFNAYTCINNITIIAFLVKLKKYYLIYVAKR